MLTETDRLLSVVSLTMTPSTGIQDPLTVPVEAPVPSWPATPRVRSKFAV